MIWHRDGEMDTEMVGDHSGGQPLGHAGEFWNGQKRGVSFQEGWDGCEKIDGKKQIQSVYQ